MASKWLEEQAAKSRAYVDKNHGSKSYGGSDYAPTKKQTAQAQKDYAAWQQRQQANQARQRQVAAALTLPSFQEHAARNLNLPMLPTVQLPQRPTFMQARPLTTPRQTQTSYTPSEPARALTASPNNSAQLQTLEPTGPARESTSKQAASGAGKTSRYNPNDPAQVAQQIRNQRRLGRYGDKGLYRVLGGDDVADYLIQRDRSAREMQALTLGDYVKNPIYAGGVLMDNLSYGLTDVGRQFANSEKAREISERNAAYTQAIGPKKAGGNAADLTAAAIERGAANSNAFTAKTANFILGAPLRALGWEKNPLQKFSDAMTAQQQETQAAYDRQFANASKGAQIAGDIGSSVVEALPDLILLAMSGGMSAAEQGETVLTRGGARLAGREAADAGARQTGRMAAARQTAQAVARDTAKNPMFWTSFSRSAGSSYEYAKSQGADDYHASLYALLNASANATVEIGGGVQTLPWELQKGGSAAWAWFKSMIEEGDEEVVQGVIERTLQNLSYGANNPIFSTSDPNAVINPVTALKEFGMGAAVAGVLGGPSSLQQGVYNLRTGRQAANNTAQEARAEQPAEATKAEEKTVPSAQVESSPAAQVVQRLSSGESVSNSALNAVMRTPEFAALYEQQTGQALPSGLTNAQLRAQIRTELQQESGLETEQTEDGYTITAPRAVGSDTDAGRGEGSITLHTNGREEVIAGPRPLTRADAVQDDKSDSSTYIDTDPATHNKQIDGTYYAVEAAPDSKAKVLAIESAFIGTEKNIKGNKGTVLNMANTPQVTPETPQRAQVSSDNSNVPHTAENVNRGLPRGDQTPQPLRRGEESDPAMAAAVAAAQPDAETNGMSRAERVDYFNRLLDSGVEHSEAHRRAFGSEKFGTGIFSPENQSVAENNASPALAKLGVKISSPIAENTNRKSIVEGNRAARKADRKLKARIKALNPSRAEMEFAQGISNGTYSEADIPLSMNSKKVTELAGLYSAAENNTGFFVQQIRRNIKRGVHEKLDGLFVSADGVQVPSNILMYLNTSQRIIRKMFKGGAGDAINEYLFDPVDANSAEKIRFMNRMFDRVREFKLKKKERVLVARVLEGRAAQKEFSLLDPDMQKRVDAVARSENPGVTRSEYGLQDDDSFQLALRYKAWLNTQARLEGQDTGKINKAADAYAEAYNDFYDGINDFLVNHGYEPIGFIQGYTPHMQTDEAKTGLSGVLQRLGLDPEVGLLPTEIAGRTDTFRPGKQWNPYFLQRTTGDPDTDYDAVEGYESYVNYMANVLYHTDDIMKLRETENYFRTRYAKDEVRDLIEEARDIANKTTEEKVRLLIRENKLAPGSVLTDEQADAQIESYIDSLYQDAKDMTKFGGFVTWLNDYTNRLAGKQTMFDRAIESFTGRRFLNIGNRLTKIFGEATIVGNFSSALNQTAQIPQLIRAVGNVNVLHAMNDIITGETRRGDWDKQSDFLTGKRGVDYVSDPSGYQKVMDFASIPFAAVDDVTSQLYVRAKYVQCIKQGMDHDAAMKAADRFATEMVGSRIQGAKPMVFEIKILKPFTTFQLEIANNWAYITQDLPAQYQEYAKQNGTAKAAAKVAGDTLKYLISAWLMNMLADKLYGGSPAPLDLIGYTFDALGADKGLTGNEYMLRAMDNLAENLTGERKLGTEEMPESVDTGAAAGALLKDVARDLPYVSNIGSAMGLVDSRMPLPAFPRKTGKDLWNTAAGGIDLLRGGDGEKAKQAAQQLPGDALKEARTWLPMGNQLYKTYTGAKALLRGGSFQGSGDEEEMQYQMPRNLMTGAKALAFGANSTKAAQDWFASGYDNLSAKETKAYRQLTGNGVDEKTAYDIMRQIHGVKAEDGTKANAEKRKIITNANLSDAQKRELFVSTFGDSRKDELEALADAGLSFKQSMKAYNEWMRLDAIEDMTGDEKATEFAAWADSQGFTTSQATAIKDQLLFSSGYQVHAEQYEKMAAEGLSPESALTVSNALDLLEPEPGREKVLAIQKYNAVVQLDISDDEKNAALMSLMNDTWRPRYQLTANVGITPEQYVMCYQATLDLKKATGKTRLNYGMATAAVNSIPGLTPQQRAVLWQVQDLSWKPSKNPYDPRVGAIVVTMLSDKPENNSLP